MSKPLILVKHSLPEIQHDRPACEWKLSSQGRLRARRLAERLNGYPIDILFSSAEPKALETAQILAWKLGVPSHAVQGLHEHDRSNVPYLSGPAFESSIQSFFEQPDRLVLGRETANQAQERFSKAVYSLREKYADQNSLVVAHGTVISLFISGFTGTPAYFLWKQLGLPSFVVIDADLKRVSSIENLT